jgi:hypothetical protein
VHHALPGGKRQNAYHTHKAESQLKHHRRHHDVQSPSIKHGAFTAQCIAHCLGANDIMYITYTTPNLFAHRKHGRHHDVRSPSIKHRAFTATSSRCQAKTWTKSLERGPKENAHWRLRCAFLHRYGWKASPRRIAALMHMPAFPTKAHAPHLAAHRMKGSISVGSFCPRNLAAQRQPGRHWSLCPNTLAAHSGSATHTGASQN